MNHVKRIIAIAPTTATVLLDAAIPGTAAPS